MILFVPLIALIFHVSYFLAVGRSFWIVYFYVFSVSNTILLYFISPYFSHHHLSDLPDLLSSSSWSSSSSVVEKISKRLLQFILDVSVLFPCLRGPFGTVLNVSSTSNTLFRLQTDLFKYSWFFISNWIMVFFDQFSCNKLSFCWRRMLLTS